MGDHSCSDRGETVTEVETSIALEIDRYLRTGDSDPLHGAWTGGDLIERAKKARDDLRGALLAEVHCRCTGAATPSLPPPEAIAALTRQKTEPMIRGLFSRAEQDAVLALAERSVVFLTSANIEVVLHAESFDKDAWDLANLYLGSLGAELLGPDAPAILGTNHGERCYVSPAYFDQADPFADFIVHEVAHIFHNCKRRTAGMPFSRKREWLLDIAYHKREVFAYACEAFARIVEQARSSSQRETLAVEFSEQFRPGDARVDAQEVAGIVLEAAGRRNGWRVILDHCTPANTRLSR